MSKPVVAERTSVPWKGKTYLPGEAIPDLPKEEVERLLLKGAIVNPKPEKKAEKKAPSKRAENGSGDKDPGKDGEDKS